MHLVQEGKAMRKADKDFPHTFWMRDARKVTEHPCHSEAPLAFHHLHHLIASLHELETGSLKVRWLWRAQVRMH
jgi:hypothetical protein